MADLSPPSMARHRLVGRFLPWLALAAGFVGFFALGLHRYISFDTLRQHRPVTFVYASVGAGLDSLFAAGDEFGAQNILAPHILMALIGLAGLALMPVLYKKSNGRAG